MKILVQPGKHGDSFYKANTPEEINESALKILRNNKHWYFEPKKPEPVEFTEDTIDSLPKSLQEEAREKLSKYNRKLREYEMDKKWYDNMILADENNDGKSAYRLISQRQDYEYESFYFSKVL